MFKDGNFGPREAISITTIAILTKILYTTSSVLVVDFGTAAWYGMSISCGFALLFFFMLCILMKRFPNKNIIQIFDEVLGKFLGKLISVAFAAYFIFYSGSVLREFLEMIKAYNLPSTKPSVILISYMLVCLIGVYLGMESIARLSYIMIYILGLGIIIMYSLSIRLYNIHFIAPYLGFGIKTTLFNSILSSSYYTEIFALAVIANSLQGYKYFKKAGIISLLISGFFFTISILCYLTAFGYNLGQENLSGIFQLTRIIFLNRFFQRMESVFLFAWVISSLLTVSLTMYIAVSIYCKTFNIKNHRPLLFPLAFIVYLISLLPPNLSQVVQVNLTIIRKYSFIPVFGIPILVLLISLIRRKKGELPDAKKS